MTSVEFQMCLEYKPDETFGLDQIQKELHLIEAEADKLFKKEVFKLNLLCF